MIAHTLLLVWRNALRNKSSFIINVAGLSLGLSVTLLIYLWVNDEVAMDRFHEKDIYQVMRRLDGGEGEIEILENNSDLLAPALREELPEIRQVVSFSTFPIKGILWNADKRFKASGRFAEPGFFEMFSYKLLEGDPSTVLKELSSVVISDELAMKFFGTTRDLVGKQLTLDEGRFGGTFLISGVFEQTRLNSEPFDFLATYEYFRAHVPMKAHWDSNTVSTYIVLQPGANVAELDVKLRDFVRDKFKAAYGEENLKWVGRLFIRSFSDRYLYNTYDNGVQSGGRIEYVTLFIIIGVLILLIACINFMNLITARASKRMKEIGVKKTVGARRRTIATQHLTESVITAFISLALSFAVIVIVLPKFNELSGKDLILSFDLSLSVAVVVIALVTGFLAGSYPALYLSGFKPVDILKGKLQAKFGEVLARKILVIFQFSVSTLLIIAVFIVKEQVDFTQSRNLGYSRTNVITFETEGDLRRKQMNSLLTELRNIAGVERASNMAGNLVGSYGGGGGVQWPGKDHHVEFAALYANYDLMESLNFSMSEGRMFSRDFIGDSIGVIFNETAIREMNLKDPIGQRVNLWGQDAIVIGVVKDFHFESLYDHVKPFMFRFARNGENVIVRLQPGKERETIAAIEKVYAKFNPGIALHYTFLDDQYAALYSAEQRVGNLSMYFAGIAIFISALGLFGLVLFATERRQKEIGVRKILGASEAAIVQLLSWDFLKLAIFATMVALPVGYFAAKEWLSTFAFRIELQWWHFALACTATFLIALITVGSQVFRSARSNPVDALRSE